MNRQEFLDILRQRLTGEVSTAVIEENIRYYREYFDQEMEKGRTEMEILNLLGDPNMLARTIIDAHGNDSTQEVYEEAPQHGHTRIHHVKMSPAVFWVILLLILVAVAAVFIRLLPVILMAGVIIYLVSRISGRR